MHAHRTSNLARFFGAVIGILAGCVHAYAYWLYGTYVWSGRIDANIVSWGLFACEFLVLIAYRDFTDDWAKDLLYIVCAVSALAIFVMVCAKLIMTGTPIETRVDRYDVAVIFLNIFVLFVWMRFRDKDAPGIIDGLIQFVIILDFIPIWRTTSADPSIEWWKPWAIWTGAYCLQLLCVALRWDGRRESAITTIHYIAWHAAMTGLIYAGAAR